MLDLSGNAFASLDNIAKGVIHIAFDIYSDPADLQVTIPEQIRPLLAVDTKKEIIPETIAQKIERPGVCDRRVWSSGGMQHGGARDH